MLLPLLFQRYIKFNVPLNVPLIMSHLIIKLLKTTVMLRLHIKVFDGNIVYEKYTKWKNLQYPLRKVLK